MQHDDTGAREFGHARPTAIRAFTLTGGRAVPRVDVGFEAVISACTTARHRQWPTGAKGDIVRVGTGLSVAEISARLNLPIGVTRVLVGDLVAEGHVEVRRTITGDTSHEERRDLLERTLRGLRNTG